ncbi:MAG: hypothetical protein KJ047_07485 [Anaerolineae bacterium]|nr:hypothetical protein [Anaerolineae bacterium]MEB2286706.1 hypothetical protein [Anaerolineae bacterium]
MMTTIIQADQTEIDIRDGSWRLYPAGPDVLSRLAVFKATRGSGVIEYDAEFGEAHGLPGTVLSMEFVQAVVLGYDGKTQRWLLGFHLAHRPEDKPRWLELVSWPPGANTTHVAEAQEAARELAEYVGCPLKVFGAKKLPQPPAPGTARSGATGPLGPHTREEIDPQRVRLFARSVTLPLQYPGVWLGAGRNDITLRVSRDPKSGKRGEEVPAFVQCIIDLERHMIRLQPPTGLLTGFFGSRRGRELHTDQVHNVELRHTITRKHTTKPEGHNLATEITHLHYTWGVYLTLADESLLLLVTHHNTSSALLRKRASVGDKFSIDSKAGIEYLRQHQADQAAYEQAETVARAVGIVIANALGLHLVKTQVGDAALS